MIDGGPGIPDTVLRGGRLVWGEQHQQRRYDKDDSLTQRWRQQWLVDSSSLVSQIYMGCHSVGIDDKEPIRAGTDGRSSERSLVQFKRAHLSFTSVLSFPASRASSGSPLGNMRLRVVAAAVSIWI